MKHTPSQQIEHDGSVPATSVSGEHACQDTIVTLPTSSQPLAIAEIIRRHKSAELAVLEESMPEQERIFLISALQQIIETEPSEMELEQKIDTVEAEIKRQKELRREAEKIRQAEREQEETSLQILTTKMTTQMREIERAQKWHQRTRDRLDELLRDCAHKEREYRTLHDLAEEQQSRVWEASYRLAVHDSVIDELRQRDAEKDRLIDGLLALLAQRDSEIASLRIIEKEWQLRTCFDQFLEQLDDFAPNTGLENAEGSLSIFPPSSSVSNMNVDSAQPGAQSDTAEQSQPMLCDDETSQALQNEFILSPSDWLELPSEQPEGECSPGERISS